MESLRQSEINLHVLKTLKKTTELYTLLEARNMELSDEIRELKARIDYLER